MSRSPEKIPPEQKIVRNHKYWKPADTAALETANSFAELSEIALRVLKRMPKPVGQVCGPISSGGLGSIPANLKRFDETIERLIRDGNSIFDQVPFEDCLFRLKGKDQGLSSKNRLLTEFYLPLFESGLVDTFYFIPGWESSQGAKWEHAQAKRLGITIVYL